MLGPTRPRGEARESASFFGADVAPPRDAQTDGGPPNGWRREPSTRNLQEIEGDIQQWFSSQAGLAHHGPQPTRTTDTQPTREFRSHNVGWIWSC
jgi:hypothetical protein